MQLQLIHTGHHEAGPVREASRWDEAPLEQFDRWIFTAKYTPLSSKIQRGYSVATQRSYRTIFVRYLRHLELSHVKLRTAQPHHVAAFLEKLSGRRPGGLASYETTRRTLTLLDRIHEELIALRVRPDNPIKAQFAKYTIDPGPQPTSTVLGPSRHDALIHYIKTLPQDTFEEARRAALLSLVAGCGLTGKELRLLPADSVVLDEDPPRVKLGACGARAEATIAIADFAIPVVLSYAVKRGATLAGALFFPRDAMGMSPLSHQTLHRYVTEALRAIGVINRVGAQRVFRATLAVRLLQKNDLSEQKIKEILRLHTDKMIERYRRHVVQRITF